MSISAKSTSVLTSPSEWPPVTVIVPAFNHARYVRICLDSIVSDGYPNVEIIIHDDGSKDDTAAVIRNWVETNSSRLPINFSVGENKGLAVVLNEALAASRGEFVTAVASDDFLLPGGIAARVRHCLRHGCDAVFADCLVVDGAGDVLYASGLSELHRARKRNLSRDLLAELITNWSVPGPVLLAKREVLEGLGGWDTRLVQEDWDLYLRLAARRRLCFLDERVSAYRLHGENLAFRRDLEGRLLADSRVTLKKALSNLRGRARVLAIVQLLAAYIDQPRTGAWSGAAHLIAGFVRRSSSWLAELSRP